MASSRRRRAPLSDLSNLSPRASSPSPSETPSFSRKLLPPKPINAVRIPLQNAAPASQPELSSDGGGHDTAVILPPHYPTSSSPAPTAMEIDACTPQARETERPSSCSSKGESFIIYSRRKETDISHLIRSCPPPRHHLKTRDVSEYRERSKAVKRGFSAAMLSKEEGFKDDSRRSRRHSLPSMQKRQWLPEDFVAAQRSHFAEVDAFQLSEEEGELSDEG